MVRKKLSSWSRSFRAGTGATSLVPDDDERRDGEQTDEAAEGKHHHKIDIVVLDGDRVGRDGTGHHACRVHKQKEKGFYIPRKFEEKDCIICTATRCCISPQFLQLVIRNYWKYLIDLVDMGCSFS